MRTGSSGGCVGTTACGVAAGISPLMEIGSGGGGGGDGGGVQWCLGAWSRTDYIGFTRPRIAYGSAAVSCETDPIESGIKHRRLGWVPLDREH